MSEEEKINISIESMSFEELRNEYILKNKQIDSYKNTMVTMEARG